MELSRLLKTCMLYIFTIGIANASYVFQDITGINNLEWLELTSTDYMSRYDVEAQLSVGGQFEGWRYATRTEVETLYDGLWGGIVDNTSSSNFSGARRFFDVFGDSSGYSSFNNSGFTNYGYSFWNAHFGNQGECSTDLTQTCRAFVSINDVNFGATSNSAYFGDSVGLSTGIDNVNEQTAWGSWVSTGGVGSHLVKVSAVPIPPSIWLFLIGFTQLIYLSKKT